MNKRFFSVAALAILTLAVCTGGAFAQAQVVGYTEDFETFGGCTLSHNNTCVLTNGWTNLTTDNFDWIPDVGGTGSFNTGPSVDHNPGTAAGTYLYTETSGGVLGALAIMESPRLDALGVGAPRANYWYHMFGAAMGNFHVDIREIFNEGTDGGTNNLDFTTVGSSNFGAMHVGTDIVITGSLLGNDGVYTITGVSAFNIVQVTPAFPAVEANLSFTHQVLTQDIIPFLAGDMGDVWLQQQITVPLTRGGTIEQFQVIYRSERGSSFTSDMAVDDFSFDQVLGDDLALANVLTPSGSAAVGTAATVSVTIFNNGLNPQTGFALQYDVNMSGNPVIEAFGGAPIASGASAVFTFATPFIIVAGPNNVVATVLLGDPTPGNDSASGTVNGVPVINSFPYFEDFEAGTGFWVNSGANDTWAHGTPAKAVMNSASSGVNCWTTGGLTGLYSNNEQSQIMGPNFDFTTLSSPVISFDIWWETEFSWDGLVLQSSIDGGVTWQNVGAFGDPNNWYNDTTITGNPGGSMEGWTGRTTSNNGSNGWLPALHDLPGLAGQPSVFLRFAFGSDASVQSEGIAIDDIRIFDPASGPGQAPQAGLAVLDINNSVDTTNMSFGVASGLGGPYTTSVLPGDTVTFHHEGAPFQAIVLLAGVTNPGLVNFPGIGQFDIGTGIGAGGTPNGLSLIADGTKVSFPDVFFRTDAAGNMDAGFPMPALAPGYVTTFQALLFTGGPTVIALTNAVELNAL